MNDRYFRFRQRREEFNKALSLLSIQSKKDYFKFDEINLAATLQFFSLTFELGWKMLKDYLKAEAIDAKIPREVIKEAFEIQLIECGHVWVEMLAARNEIAHIYNEDRAKKLLLKIMEKFVEPLVKLGDDVRCLG